MVFSYYKKLNAGQKGIYRRSDAIHSVLLPNAAELRPLIPRLADSLGEGLRPRTESLSQELATGIAAGLHAPPLRIRVLAARPSAAWGELHGLYVPSGNSPALITVWMRTAQRRQVVAFRSFLRTLLHEICHHIDYELLLLEESYHTEGFYKRESSLFHQLTDVPA
jgi:hypothetical protein